MSMSASSSPTSASAPLPGSTPKPTSEDVSIPAEPSTWQYVSAGAVVVLLGLGYLSYKHFYLKQPSIFALPNGDDKNELFKAIGLVFAAVGLNYALFFLFGFGTSLAYTQYKCSKTSLLSQAKLSALFAINPAVTYLIIRVLTILRVHYDRIMLFAGLSKEVAGVWSVGAFMATWILFSAIMLVDDSATAACVPSASEATQFKEAVLKAEAARSAKNQPPAGQSPTD
jgi:hypothetical protein